MFGSWDGLGLGFAVAIAGGEDIVVVCSVVATLGPVKVACILLASPFVLSTFVMASA